MVVNAIISLIALVCFVCFFYGPWQATCTDWSRQITFERRDRLFDMAASGQLDFASDEYKAIREALNCMIRFAHELTWINLLFFLKARERMGLVSDRPEFMAAIDRIENTEVQKRVRDLFMESTIGMIAMMALKSILVAPLAFALCIVALCSKGFKYLVQRNPVVQKLSEAIQIEAQITAL